MDWKTMLVNFGPLVIGFLFKNILPMTGLPVAVTTAGFEIAMWLFGIIIAKYTYTSFMAMKRNGLIK